MNGFQNYDTYAAKRWIDDDQRNGDWYQWAREALEFFEDGDGPNRRLAIIRLAYQLEDMFQGRLHEVDWMGIAAAMVDVELADWPGTV